MEKNHQVAKLIDTDFYRKERKDIYFWRLCIFQFRVLWSSWLGKWSWLIKCWLFHLRISSKSASSLLVCLKMVIFPWRCGWRYTAESQTFWNREFYLDLKGSSAAPAVYVLRIRIYVCVCVCMWIYTNRIFLCITAEQPLWNAYIGLVYNWFWLLFLKQNLGELGSRDMHIMWIP